MEIGDIHKGFVNHFYDFWIQNSHHFYNIWIRKSISPFSEILNPETALFLRFYNNAVAYQNKSVERQLSSLLEPSIYFFNVCK